MNGCKLHARTGDVLSGTFEPGIPKLPRFFFNRFGFDSPAVRCAAIQA